MTIRDLLNREGSASELNTGDYVATLSGIYQIECITEENDQLHFSGTNRGTGMYNAWLWTPDTIVRYRKK